MAKVLHKWIIFVDIDWLSVCLFQLLLYFSQLIRLLMSSYLSREKLLVISSGDHSKRLLIVTTTTMMMYFYVLAFELFSGSILVNHLGLFSRFAALESVLLLTFS